jgi:hypothetical protein
MTVAPSRSALPGHGARPAADPLRHPVVVVGAEQVRLRSSTSSVTATISAGASPGSIRSTFSDR